MWEKIVAWLTLGETPLWYWGAAAAASAFGLIMGTKEYWCAVTYIDMQTYSITEVVCTLIGER